MIPDMKKAPALSIRSKLTLIVMTPTCAAVLVSLVALGFWDQLRFRSRLCSEALTRAEILAGNSTAALTFSEPGPTQEMLRALGADPHLGAAAIFDARGKLFARYVRPGWKVPLPARPLPDSAVFHEKWLEVFHAVRLNGQRLGTVVLQDDLEELWLRRSHGISMALLVLGLAAAVGFVLATRLQRCISQPILRLSETARAVAAEKNYNVRVPKHAEDELGQLIDGFNSMLAQIEARDAALQQAHADLEIRVAERTGELFSANTLLKAEVDAHKRAREDSEVLSHELEGAYEHLQREAEERAGVQEALRRSEERFSKAFRASPVALAILTQGSRAFVDVNDRFAELAGCSREAIIGGTMFSLPLWSVPETRARIEQLLADGLPVNDWQCRIAGPGDQTRAARLSAVTFVLGTEPCVLLMTEDVSEHVNLESQLRQAQKMDAIGQLASGLAHDFNNLLTIIQGYAQVISAMPSAQGMVRDSLEKVVGACQRGAQLTRQLLTFSRKQVPQPKVLELNQVVDNLISMLQPLLGEQVRLKWNPGSGAPCIEGDAGMLEQVLVNLAVNARDAMPHGGDLIIGTFECEIDASYAQYRPQAKPGRFVCLQVSDTGCGMDSLTLERIFEPFFTTKSIGKGTGLGLATVYGIIKQHRGWIEVASQPSVGTTFKIFLPTAQSTKVQPEPGADDQSIRGGHETILVVEDEPVLRELETSILRNLGYDVLEAAHGKEALALWQRLAPKPALLLTDIMMPEGINGLELADRLRLEVPLLKVVYTSGYSPELFGGQVTLQDRSNFLPKPFHPQMLARTVRQSLDR
jgi:two-component system cell cycle sensor histidine kinase/response regulator CckA